MAVTTKRELAVAEDAGWARLIWIIETLDPQQIERPGYLPEGWSVKDLMGHIGCWQAEAGQMLERIHNDTYHESPVDVPALNLQFYESNKDLPLPVVRAELWSARTRMLVGWNRLLKVTRAAEEWFRESGPAHYDEHIERLQEWAAEVRGDSA